MQLVTFYDGVKTIDISLAKDAGYAFPLPFMPVVVDMLTLTTPVGETRMAIKNTRLELEHLALSVADGEANLYYHGYELLTASTGAFEVERFELGEGVHSEHILSPKNARPEDISTWSNMRSPFFDPSPVVPDSQIPSAEEWSRKARTFYQDTPPVASGVGDIWFDISDHNHRYWWDGTKWADVSDTSPVDASQRPIHARGLGGDIEMDHTGMRFIRKADGKTTLQMDIETGSAYFRGDITGASGTFTGPVKSFGSNGDYSLLDAGRLKFFKNINGQEVESYYVARMASGVNEDGYVVELPYWERPPQIITSLNTLSNLQDDVYVAHSEPESLEMPGGGYKFTVFCRNMKRGVSKQSSEAPFEWTQPASPTTYTFQPTEQNTTWLSMSLEMNGSGYCGFLNGKTIFNYRIEVAYRLLGEQGWNITVYNQQEVCSDSGPIPINFRKEVPSGQYEVKLTQTRRVRVGGTWRENGGLKVNNFSWRADQVYNTGLVSWIAFEGGSV